MNNPRIQLDNALAARMRAAKQESMAVIQVWLFFRQETDKAALFSREAGSKTAFWLPKALISFNTTDDGLALVELPEWLARRKFLI